MQDRGGGAGSDLGSQSNKVRFASIEIVGSFLFVDIHFSKSPHPPRPGGHPVSTAGYLRHRIKEAAAAAAADDG